MPIHFLNGRFVEEDELLISPKDLGFARGYAVFDFLITYRRKPFMLSKHIERLLRSADAIGLSVPWDKEQISGWVLEAIDKNREGEKAIKIFLSGGVSASLLPAEEPTIIITADPFKPFPEEYYNDGVTVIPVEYSRYTPEAKTNNYIEAVKQVQMGQEINAIEPLYYSKDQVFECSTSNVFAVMGGRLATPKSNILEGITREVLLDILDVGMPVISEDFKIEELFGAEEVFITGSNKEVMPVTRIDQKPVGDGRVGATTQKAMEQFRKFTDSDRWIR